MLTISLSPDLESRLRGTAERLGEDPALYAQKLIRQGLPGTNAGESTLALFAKWDAEDTTGDPSELARRAAEFEQLKASLNATRRESGGDAARLIYP